MIDASALNCSVKQRVVTAGEGRGDIPILYIYYAEVQPTEAENRLPTAILGKLSGKTSKNCYYNKIFATFVLGCRIGSLVLVAFRLLFCEVKRPKFIKQVDNRHIKCSRLLAWVCLYLYGYLVVPSSQ